MVVVRSKWRRCKINGTATSLWDCNAIPPTWIALKLRSPYDSKATCSILLQPCCSLVAFLLRPDPTKTAPKMFWTYSKLLTIITIMHTSPRPYHSFTSIYTIHLVWLRYYITVILVSIVWRVRNALKAINEIKQPRMPAPTLNALVVLNHYVLFIV